MLTITARFPLAQGTARLGRVVLDPAFLHLFLRSAQRRYGNGVESEEREEKRRDDRDHSATRSLSLSGRSSRELQHVEPYI